jgi:hypothetical protein
MARPWSKETSPDYDGHDPKVIDWCNWFSWMGERYPQKHRAEWNRAHDQSQYMLLPIYEAMCDLADGKAGG